MSQFYKLVVKEVTRETPEAISVTFSVPNELADKYLFDAGQYVTLKLTLDGKEISRAYSICAAPMENTLKIAIKAIPNGTFSVWANQNLKEGNLLEVGLPEGNFTFKPNALAQNNYVCVATGSGITPILSIIKTILTQEFQSKVTLFYGNKNLDNVIFYNDLMLLHDEYFQRFTIEWVYSQQEIEQDTFGRISYHLIKNYTQKEPIDAYYLCGVEQMITDVSEGLKNEGYAPQNIHYELFTASATEQKIETLNGNTQLSILLDDEEHELEILPNQTVLEAILKQNIDAPYSCQGGVCSSCAAKIIEGSAQMKKNNALSESDVANGLILTCQAVPTSGILKIDFDI